MSDIEQRKLWRIQWLESINVLTDFELQEKSWLDDKNSNPHWSFVEFMCCYFDDLSLSVLGYEYFINNNLISKPEYLSIKNWHEDLDKYKSPSGDDYDHQAILSDEKWKRIVTLGSTSKNRLFALLSTEEKVHLKKIQYVA